MRSLVLVALLACGPAAADPAPESEGSEGPPVEPASSTAEPEPEPPSEVPPPSCNIWCMRGDGPCGRWIGQDPMEWIECPLECCDMSDPASAKPVTLEELVDAASGGTAPATIRSLGGHRISPQCVGIQWESLPGDRERGTCPAGWVHLGRVRATLSVEVTRAVGDGTDSTTVLHLRAETPGATWTSALEDAANDGVRQPNGEWHFAEVRMTLTAEGADLTRR